MPEAAFPVLPKREPSRELSLDSPGSSVGAEDGAGGEPERGLDAADGPVSPPAEAQVQKRKGGRKPVGMEVRTRKEFADAWQIYATSEERKQRNRQAQAAFRERRTEYIKQLETTIKHQEDTLQNLQQNHRSAADECLMLRYKNSLLERILLEKGTNLKILPLADC